MDEVPERLERQCRLFNEATDLKGDGTTGNCYTRRPPVAEEEPEGDESDKKDEKEQEKDVQKEGNDQK